MSAQPGIAVLTDTAIIDAQGSRPYPAQNISHAIDIATIGLSTALPYCAIWIAPGSQVESRSRRAAFWIERDGWHSFTTGEFGEVPSAGAFRRDAKGYQRECDVMANIVNRWMISPKIDAETLYLAIVAYEATMGVQARYSPSYAAIRVLEEENSTDKRKDWIAPLDGQLALSIEWPSVAALNFARRPTRDEMQLTYLHVYDKNSAYLAAAQSLMVGCGNPIAAGANDYDKKGYGLWYIKARPNSSAYDGEHMPSPFGSSSLLTEGWYYTPQVDCAISLGWHVDVVKGWLWSETHNTLNPWAKRIYAARQKTLGEQNVHAGKLAEAMIKKSFTMALGIMGRAFQPDEATKIRWMHRRDWYGALIASSYRTHLSLIAKYAEQGLPLIAGQVDSIAFLSNEANPALAIPGIMDRASALGGYKHVLSLTGAFLRPVLEAADQGSGGAALFTKIRDAQRAQRRASVTHA